MNAPTVIIVLVVVVAGIVGYLLARGGRFRR